jgi:hypothetical protein
MSFVPSDVDDAVKSGHSMEETENSSVVVRRFECVTCGASAAYDPGTGHVQGSATYLECGARGSR